MLPTPTLVLEPWSLHYCGSLRLGGSGTGEQLIAGYSQGAASGNFEVWILECRGSSLWIPGFHDPVAETTHADRAGSQPVRYVPDASENRTFIYHCLLTTCFRKGHSLLHPFLCWSLSCSHVTLRQYSSVLKRQRPRSTFQGNRNSLRLVQV